MMAACLCPPASSRRRRNHCPASGRAGPSLVSEGVRLYFEVRELDDFCHKLMRKGFYITQMPRMMEWGWRHAYLNDPDGHEISLYWAGEKRMSKSVMQAARTQRRAKCTGADPSDTLNSLRK